MYKHLFLILFLFLFISCDDGTSNSIPVNDSIELNLAIEKAMPGDEIILSNGVWKDIQIKFTGQGTKEQPIVLRAETAGKVSIEGISNLTLAGEYLEVKGFYFRNGYSPTKNVIAFRIDQEKVANHCKVSECVILDFNKPQRDQDDLWVQFFGRHNQLDHCYIAGKTNGGPTVRVDLKGNQSIRNFHKIKQSLWTKTKKRRSQRRDYSARK